jgi:hypothetical protein
MNLKIQHSADGTTNWTDSGLAFDVTGTGGMVYFNVDGLQKFVRAVLTPASEPAGTIVSATIVGDKAQS